MTTQLDRRTILTTGAQEGKTYKELGNVLGVSGARVQQLYKQFGIETRKTLRKKKQIEEDEDTFVLEPSEKNFRRICRKKFQAKKANASRTGIPFTVKFDELVFPERCPALGIELDYYKQLLGDNSPSFDRLDPTEGYTKENTIIISFRANKIKQDASPQEIRAVYLFLQHLRPSVGKFE